jgi:rhamnosyltransferase
VNVQILLSTYNGEKYLKEQLDSLIEQIGVNISILVRDDGSTDSTKEILEHYQKKGFLIWYSGENLQPAYSFFDLMKKASLTKYYAFCDQDDVWDNNKLIVAVEELKKFDPEIPSMYFSKAKLVDENLNEICNGRYPIGKFTFGTALIRNNVTGCTLVLNRKLLEQANHYTPQYVLMHDHWVYLVCLALNGNVVYDPVSHIKYRQHVGNVCGGNNSLLNRYKSSGFNDLRRIRYKIAVELFENYHEVIPDNNLELLKKFINYSNSFQDKLSLIFDKDIKVHSFLLDLALVINILRSKL